MSARDELAEVIYKARWVDGIKDAGLVSDGALADAISAAGFIHETEALTMDELYRAAGHLAGDGTTEGLILADMLNRKFGASARRRRKAWAA